MERDGSLMLAYGAMQGPPRLIEPLRARLGRLEGVAPSAEEGMITGGVSWALDVLCTQLARPTDVVLVAVPAYHLALKVFRGGHLQLEPAVCDDEGIVLDSLEKTLAKLRPQDERVCLLYIVPTCANPTGSIVPFCRRKALVQFAERSDLTILEDDVYRGLWYDLEPPPCLHTIAPTGTVIRLGSFSRVLASGRRLGWMAGSPDVIRRCVDSGMISSGGISHFAAHIVASFIQLGLLDGHVEMLRPSARRGSLVASLAEHVPPACH